MGRVTIRRTTLSSIHQLGFPASISIGIWISFWICIRISISIGFGFGFGFGFFPSRHSGTGAPVRIGTEAQKHRGGSRCPTGTITTSECAALSLWSA